MNHIIFDMFHKTIAFLLTECCVTPPDMCGKLLELDEALHSLMVFMHVKLFEFGFGFSFRVESAKVGFEFLNEEFKVQKPDGISSIQECRFETI